MSGRRRFKMPAEMELLRDQITGWRKDKQGHVQMPLELWQSAVEFAKEFGVHRVATSLHISYNSLKKRFAEKGFSQLNGRVDFVEISSSKVPASRIRIELSRKDGVHAVIENADDNCVYKVAAAFLNESR